MGVPANVDTMVTPYVLKEPLMMMMICYTPMLAKANKGNYKFYNLPPL